MKRNTKCVSGAEIATGPFNLSIAPKRQFEIDVFPHFWWGHKLPQNGNVAICIKWFKTLLNLHYTLNLEEYAAHV